jgi:hypothetical protein
MKKRILLLGFVVALALIAAACGNKEKNEKITARSCKIACDRILNLAE